MLDVEGLLAPHPDAVSPGAPCGPDMRGDPEFRDIEDAPGDFAGLKAPELLAVVARCDALLARTMDQAPALVAFQAAVRAGDLPLAGRALALVKGFAEHHWEDFHPGPAGEMAIARINELSALARPAAVVLPIQRMALARLPAPSPLGFTATMLGLACAPVAEWSSDDEAALAAQVENGQVSATQARTVRPNRDGARTLRTIARTLSPDARAADAEAGVGGESIGMDAATLATLAHDLRAQVEEAAAGLRLLSDLLYDINAIYDARVGDSASLGPVQSAIRMAVEEAERFLAAFPVAGGQEAEGAGAADAAGGEGPGGGPAPSGGAAPRGFVVTTPQSRADVVTALEAIGRFFVEHEPTSPVPLMLRRVRAWVEMDFLQLLGDIAPGALDDAQRLLASPEETSIDEY